MMKEFTSRELDLIWPPPHDGKEPNPSDSARPWLGIQFECCDVYTRVYRKPEDTEYVAKCPKCGREVRAKVGPGGVSARLFRAKIL